MEMIKKFGGKSWGELKKIVHLQRVAFCGIGINTKFIYY